MIKKDGEFARLIKNFIHEKEHEEQEEKEEKEEAKFKESKRSKESKIVSVEEREVGRLNQRVYLDYFTSLGGNLLVFLIFLVFVFEMVTKVGSDFWLSTWTGDPNSENHGVHFYVAIYTAWGFINLLMVFGRGSKSISFQKKKLIHFLLKSLPSPTLQ